MLIYRLKSIAGQIPEPIGKILAHIPFDRRLGIGYEENKRLLRTFESKTPEQQKDDILARVKGIHSWSAENHPFYREFYSSGKAGFDRNSRFEDIGSIPIVTKDDLQGIPLENRALHSNERLKASTGGSSGQPLVFYHDSQAFAREWAYMHFIWSQVGYDYKDLSLGFRGKNLGARPLVYNLVHNEYLTNAYIDCDIVAAALVKKTRSNPIRYIHGFPSSIYEFIRHCVEYRPAVIDMLRESIKGILYTSEYPSPDFREFVDGCLEARSISWYGHSEFSVLAYEKEKYLFAPLHSYGYAEAVPGGEGHRLICTGYYNKVCPFIRYDTGDLIEPVENDGVLRSFRITYGRKGDFIIDRESRRISLTDFIFGRTHAIVNAANFVQISQVAPGEAVMVITKKPNSDVTPDSAAKMMDLTNIGISFRFMIVDRPFRTRAGKVNLKIPFEQIAFRNSGQSSR